MYEAENRFKAGNKPPTCFLPEGLVEQKLKTLFERNTIDDGNMRHKNKDAKKNKRLFLKKSKDMTKAGERARQVREQTQSQENKTTKKENKRERRNKEQKKKWE